MGCLDVARGRRRGVAKLTGAVNIAVFAAFWLRVGGVLLANAVFKPYDGDWQHDIARSGRQTRQDMARNGNEVATDGKVDGKRGKDGWVCRGMELSRCQRRGMAPHI
jgi:hypothetical protein